jgi:hypothetical protein
VKWKCALEPEARDSLHVLLRKLNMTESALEHKVIVCLESFKESFLREDERVIYLEEIVPITSSKEPKYSFTIKITKSVFRLPPQCSNMLTL